jgi:ATPase subunit of ABC transporter with duplicated ATPase domains
MFNCLNTDSASDQDSDVDISTLVKKKAPIVEKQKQNQKSKQHVIEIDSDDDLEIELVDNEPKQNKGNNKKNLKKDKKDEKRDQQKKNKKEDIKQNKLFEQPVQQKDKNGKIIQQKKKQVLPTGTLFADDVEILLGGKVLIQKSNLVINSGIKYFLLGKNGCGKTTLLKYIYEALCHRDDILMIDQDIHITSDLTVKNFLLQANKKLYEASERVAELEKIAEDEDMSDDEMEEMETLSNILKVEGWGIYVSEAQIILNGLGFNENQVVNSLSGGWRMKLALGKALLTKPNVLLLDESTNHLDLISVIWLTDYLKQYNKTIIMTTHETGVVDDLADYVWFIENIDDEGNKLYSIKGQYGNMCQTIEQMTKEISEGQDKLKKQVKELQNKSTPKKDVEEFVENYTKKNKIRKLAKPYKVTISFEDVAFKSSQNIIEMTDVDFSYGEKQILKKVNFSIDIKSRYVIVGRNGVGKTTLFKLCSGMIKPTGGEIRKNDRISVGYYNQQIIEGLPLDLTPIQYLQSLNPQLDENQCRARLGKIGLKKVNTGDQCKTKISDLSGGQKARMAFCVIQMQSPEILLLDEPTNHLDIESIRALKEGINNFTGAIIIITHDTHLIESIENYVIYEVAGTKVTKFNGDFQGYTDYVIKQLKK